MNQKNRLNVLMLILTPLLGVGAWFFCYLFYSVFTDILPKVLLIGIVFMLFALVMSLGVFLISLIQGVYQKNIYTGRKGGPLVPILVCTLILGVLGAVFQFIYGLRINIKQSDPTSYIFLIDNSGSMLISDPDEYRYDAIEEVLEGKPGDFQYMVYGFATDIQVLREMQPIDQNVHIQHSVSNGGTAIRGALERALKDHQDGVWSGGNNPRVILLTDGYATDIFADRDLNGVLKEYAKEGLTVSAVGLGEVDKSLMKRIAGKTGGVFIEVDESQKLGEAMGNAAVMSSSDDLLNSRSGVRADGLYGFLRVLFLTLLGTGLGFIVSIGYGYIDSVHLIWVTSAITSLVGALALELLLASGSMGDEGCMLIAWLLMALTICTQPSKKAGPVDPGNSVDITGRSGQIV